MGALWANSVCLLRTAEFVCFLCEPHGQATGDRISASGKNQVSEHSCAFD